MFDKLAEINKKKSFGKIANAFLIILIFHLLFIFAIYYSTKFAYKNPLIPKDLAFEVFAPYAQKGLIVTFGLLIATIFKFMKQNLVVILSCLIVIAIYYFTSFEPDFVEYQK